jgi:squalene-associated FAD-dependent desaturase
VEDRISPSSRPAPASGGRGSSPADRPRNRADVIVIGGGVAGLAAATQLADRGARVVVVEARPRLGGRASSYIDPETGEMVDNGQHVLMGCYRETFAFLRRIGAMSRVRVQPSLAVPSVDTAGRHSVLSCPPLPAPWHLLGGVVEWDALGWMDRLSVLRLGRPVRTEQRRLRGATHLMACSPEETVENWLIRNGQTARLREMLWDPLALAALNQPPRDAAAPTFVRVLAEMFGPDPQAASIAFPAVPLDAMYAAPARDHIEAHGGQVMTNALARVIAEGGRAIGVRTRGGSDVHAQAIVAAVPWFAVRSLFDDVPVSLQRVVSDAGRMASYPIVTVNLWFDRSVLGTPFVGLPGRTMQWAFDRGALTDARVPLVSLVSSGALAVAGLTNDATVNLALRELRDALPRARPAVVRKASVVRERRATFSLAPGQPARPATDTPLAGFYLAGDWTDTGLPGTIESAAASGHRAAEAVALDPSVVAPAKAGAHGGFPHSRE